MALRIDPNGLCREVEPQNGSDFQLDELYSHIGCQMIKIQYASVKNLVMITEDGEPYRLNGELLVIMDEEGKLKRSPENFAASFIYDRRDDVVVGTVVVCKPEEVK